MNAQATKGARVNADAHRARAAKRVNDAKHKTREQWLNALVAKLRTLFRSRGYVIPDRVRVSCGWPATGATRGKGKRVLGQAWSQTCSADGAVEIFISPIIDSVDVVAATLVHELVHATVGTACGHGPKFRACAETIGLAGKMTETHVGPHLLKQLATICEPLGEYPHAAISPTDGHKKQGTRMLKFECPECGWSGRTTAKHLEAGLPTCHCGENMQVAE